ncbi:MAG: glycosyltransferase family 4 protein [Planctomycetota bacterium]|nr:glycosyltransferase family 4 protein [Planctomycetota bacterium]
MKLLYVIHQYFPDCFSGTEQYCLAASREARRRGDEVVVLSLDPDPARQDPPLLLYDQPYDGFTVLRLRHWRGLQPNDVLRDYENPHVARLFGSVLDQQQPDAVHFFHLRNLGSDLLDVAVARGVRTVVNLMDFWYLCPRFTLLRSDGEVCEGPPDGGRGCIECAYPDIVAGDARHDALLQRKDTLLGRLASVDAVIAPSRFLAGMFEKNGFPADRMEVVRYGLEPGRVERRLVQRPRSPLRLAFVGVLSPWKAAHVAVDAVRKVSGDVHLTVHGRTEEYMFRDYIADLLQRAAGDERISFPGAFDRASVSDVMADTDLLVVPSTWYENTPFVILEAFEAGVGVICSDLGGMVEVIEDGVNGFRFEAGNAEAMAGVIERCLADPQSVARLDPRPAGTIADNYDRFLDAYAG